MADLEIKDRRIDALEREISALRKDAKRYRWLRNYGCWLDPTKYAKAGRVLDAEIDTLMGEE